MKFQFRIAGLLSLISFVAVSISLYLWLNPAPEIPSTWDQKEIVNAAIRSNDNVVGSDVLVWMIKEDGRPLLVQSCILWLQLQDSAGRVTYHVCHLYRHPNSSTGWELAFVFDAPIPYEQAYNTPPTSSQIMDFLDRTDWNWEIDEDDGGFTVDLATGELEDVDGFKYVDGRVCTNAWKRRTGQSFSEDVPVEFLNQSRHGR